MPPRFPWWVPLGAAVLAAGYLPTLTTPFDFIDDGNLVYPAVKGTTLAGHLDLWWAKVVANYEHLGPVRPVLWAAWELTANLTGGDPLAWRAVRLAQCYLAAAAMLWFFRELKVPAAAALVAGAAAMWNPYRNEIWTSLTLAEGIAMPNALLALVAARKAAASGKPWRWDALALFGTVMALGCKNTFAALVPVQMLLRTWPDGLTLREGWAKNRWRAALLALPLLLPAAHFVYFKTHWHPGQYETHGPTLAQAGRELHALKGAAGLDFLGAGLAVAAVVVLVRRPPVREAVVRYRAALVAAGALLACGFAAYLPMAMMSGRYTMPAVWGLDVLIALLLASLGIVAAWPKRIAWAAVWAGVLALAVANAGRQEKFAARARLLWDALEAVEKSAPPGAVVAWVCGDSAAGELNVEEGIHFRWHLLHRGRADIQVRLIDAAGNVVERVELPATTGEPVLRLAGGSAAPPGWEAGRSFAESYWAGRRSFACHLSRRPAAVARK